MGDETRREDLERDFADGGWQFWASSTGGLVYARRPKASPPLTLHAEDWTALRDEIVAAEARIEQRDYWQAELAEREAEQARWDRHRTRKADTSD